MKNDSHAPSENESSDLYLFLTVLIKKLKNSTSIVV